MKKILVIEDDSKLAQIYQEKLTEEGFEVALAATGEKGLQLTMTTLPDLIILDVMLPGGQNGFDVLEQLKRNSTLKAIPVLMLTNLDGQETIAREIGAVDYIVKANTSLEEVVTRIKSHIPDH